MKKFIFYLLTVFTSLNKDKFLSITQNVTKNKTASYSKTKNLQKIDEFPRSNKKSIETCIKMLKQRTFSIEKYSKIFEIIIFSLQSSRIKIGFNVSFLLSKFVDKKHKFCYILNILWSNKLKQNIKNSIKKKFLRFLFYKYSDFKAIEATKNSLLNIYSSDPKISQAVSSFNSFLVSFAKNNFRLYKTSFVSYFYYRGIDKVNKKRIIFGVTKNDLQKLYKSTYFKRASQFCPVLKEIENILNTNKYANEVMKRLHFTISMFCTKFNTLNNLLFNCYSGIFHNKYIPKYKVNIFYEFLVDSYLNFYLSLTRANDECKLKKYIFYKAFTLYCLLKQIHCKNNQNEITLKDFVIYNINGKIKIITKRQFFLLEGNKTCIHLIKYLE